MTRAAIIGAGSLGTVIGALMAKGGRPVELVDTHAAHVRALNAHGACISGQITLCQPVRALTPDQMRGSYDLVFLLTKQTTNPQVLADLAPHLHEDSLVCTLQNGIPEPAVVAALGARRVIGGTVGFGATWLGPGQSSLTTAAEVVRDHAFEIGEIDGPPRPRLDLAQAYLGCVGHTRLLDDLMGVRWSKLLMNATFSGLSAALGCDFGEVLDNPTALRAVLRIAEEVARAARAEGHDLAPLQGEDFRQFACPGDAATLTMVHRIWNPHRRLRASMLQDLEKCRDTEIDHINGLVCAAGRRHGFATPVNDLVVALVHEAQARRMQPGFANIRRFAALLDSAPDPAQP
ncbi:ketopantoate reductase family protein [Salipiger marinus]|uniref:ketopantoate reductase family protein n=1 Tax=Salipiger marinus TaxID=555512 RepID=UPI002CD526FE|nr:ketopantoate reductase family protein [Salipiger manganoxidans]MEB3419243.1 ketopantoate reductase family protein [Salipiger manganoxidans]